MVPFWLQKIIWSLTHALLWRPNGESQSHCNKFYDLYGGPQSKYFTFPPHLSLKNFFLFALCKQKENLFRFTGK